MAQIRGTNGRDTRFGTAGNDVFFMYDGDDYAFGNDGNDVIHGGLGKDYLSGGDGNDTLFGDKGFDRLFGGNGRDILNGGPGSDDLTGGAGADTFQYLSITGDDAPNGDQFVDFIKDFSLADGDRIGVAQIDANPDRAGNQAFRFIGGSAFSGSGGEVRFSFENDPAGDPQTRVQFDTDGDRSPDLTVLLTNGFVLLTPGDFYL